MVTIDVRSFHLIKAVCDQFPSFQFTSRVVRIELARAKHDAINTVVNQKEFRTLFILGKLYNIS